MEGIRALCALTVVYGHEYIIRTKNPVNPEQLNEFI